MRISERTGLWLLAAALPASLEFSYAHLQHLGLWPLQLIASSLWRLLGANGTDSAAAAWAPAAALVLIGLVAEALAVWTGRRSWRENRTAQEGGDDHE